VSTAHELPPPQLVMANDSTAKSAIEHKARSAVLRRKRE
jgi:hypothetical protein